MYKCLSLMSFLIYYMLLVLRFILNVLTSRLFLFCPFFSFRRRHTSSLCDSAADVFFFQAEDGIRDHCVTGVQTCALPISNASSRGAFGNTATRLEAFVVAGGAYVYGSYPDIDGLFREQGAELDRKKREALLHRIQQLVHERVMFIPIWQLAFLNGVGPRVEESGLGLIAGHAYSAPYEDLTLRAR